MKHVNRRTFIKTTGAGFAAVSLAGWGFAAEKKKGAAGIAICDWTLGGPAGRGNPDMVAKAKEVGFGGIQISVGKKDPDNVPLRDDPKVREHYAELSKANNICIVSTAPTMLNQYPLFSDERAPGLVIASLEASQFLGAKCILVPSFGAGDLLVKKDKKYIDLKDGEFSSYEINTEAFEKAIEVLRGLVPHAERTGVIIGLENTLTAKQNIELIEKAGSKMVQVYYDVGNSWGNGYDVPGEIRLLGKERICQVHLKDKGDELFGGEKAEVDMPACAKALEEIGYEDWYVLENRGRKDKEEEDTKSNIAYTRKTFRFAA